MFVLLILVPAHWSSVISLVQFTVWSSHSIYEIDGKQFKRFFYRTSVILRLFGCVFGRFLLQNNLFSFGMVLNERKETEDMLLVIPVENRFIALKGYYHN